MNAILLLLLATTVSQLAPLSRVPDDVTARKVMELRRQCDAADLAARATQSN